MRDILLLGVYEMACMGVEGQSCWEFMRWVAWAWRVILLLGVYEMVCMDVEKQPPASGGGRGIIQRQNDIL